MITEDVDGGGDDDGCDDLDSMALARSFYATNKEKLVIDRNIEFDEILPDEGRRRGRRRSRAIWWPRRGNDIASGRIES